MTHHFVFVVLLSALPLSGALHAQSAAELEARLRKASAKSEQMNLYFEISKKIIGSNAAKAADYANKAADLAVQLGEKRTAAEATYLAADAYYRRRDNKNAAAKALEAWNLARNYGLRDVALDAVGKLEEVATREENTAEALKWSRETVSYLKSTGGRAVAGADASRKLETRVAELEAENRRLRDEIAGLTGQTQVLETNVRQETEAQIKEIQEKSQEEMVRRDEEISKIKLEKLQVDSMARVKDKLVASLTKEQIAARLVQSQLAEAVQTEKAKAAESEVARQKSENMRNVLALLSCFVLLLALLFYIRFRAKRRTANALAEKNAIIEAEQQKIDALLLNILPPAIANELKARNKVAARQYPKATVMFIDFKGFTKVAESLSPEGLVELLDYCFTNFDRIISRYNIEKIKTVGDAYICASGLSDKNASPSDMVRAALEIQDFLLHTRAARMDQNQPFFEARVGIHTGPVVAGVVGEKKFAYDIWGDTVNTAARMEEACDTGRVNVSEDAYWLAKYEFEWEFRGKIAAKNKGLMDMYYVTAIKQY
jgi:class 3 adenylate cyclase